MRRPGKILPPTTDELRLIAQARDDMERWLKEHDAALSLLDAADRAGFEYEARSPFDLQLFTARRSVNLDVAHQREHGE